MLRDIQVYILCSFGVYVLEEYMCGEVGLITRVEWVDGG